MLAYYCGMGMTLQQAVKALYMYSYYRGQTGLGESSINGPTPKVLYNGGYGIDGCGEDILESPKDWDVFFKKLEERPQSMGCVSSSSSSSSTSESESSTASSTTDSLSSTELSTTMTTTTQGSSDMDRTETTTAPGETPTESPGSGDDSDDDEGEEAPPEEVDVPESFPGDVPTVPWVPGGYIAAGILLLAAGAAAGIFAVLVPLQNGTTATVTVTVPAVTPGQTVKLSDVVPTSIQKQAAALTSSINVSNIGSMPITAMPTPTPALPVPTQAVLNHCYSIQKTIRGTNESDTKQIYRYVERDLVAEGIKQLCTKHPGIQNKTERSGWYLEWYYGSPNHFSLNILWKNNYPTDEQCLTGFTNLFNTCNGGGYNFTSGGRRREGDFIYEIIPLYYERQPPRDKWVSAFMTTRYFDFNVWVYGYEHLVWGYRWLDHYDARQFPLGGTEFYGDMEKCKLLHFEWTLINGPNGTLTPWEWRIQIFTKPDSNSCVLDVLKKWSGVKDLKYSEDLEKKYNVHYPSASERSKHGPGFMRPYYPSVRSEDDDVDGGLGYSLNSVKMILQ
ncbi:hypothetical protein AA313_de0208864 [Arthrobotrys entomopaga]|nr:hypothetical protein AA313_de0208864 [Arthrobotrys entomopaga]